MKITVKRILTTFLLLTLFIGTIGSSPLQVSAASETEIYVLTKIGYEKISYTSNWLIKKADFEGYTYTYDSNGRIKQKGCKSFKYDSSGRVVSYKDTNGKTCKITYNKNGYCTSENRPWYPGATEIVKKTYRYNAQGAVTSTTTKIQYSSTIKNTFQYDAYGNVEKTSQFGHFYTYKDGRITKDSDIKAGFDLKYTYKKVKVPSKLAALVKAQQNWLINYHVNGGGPSLLATYKPPTTKAMKAIVANKTTSKSVKTKKTSTVAKSYKITYKLNGGKNNSSNPKTFKPTKSVTLKDPSRAGYKFSGWYSDSKKIKTIAKGTTGNITITAEWKKIVGKKVENKIVSGKYKDGALDINMTWYEYYTDRYFTEKKSTTEQGGLARASMLGAATAYNKKNAKAFLEQCGFTKIYRYKPDTNLIDNNYVHATFGYKIINEVPIVAVLIRGTANLDDWISNFTLGNPFNKWNVHLGFKLAVGDLYGKLTQYLETNGINEEVSKFWITGHSRGAVVGNLLAAGLNSKIGKSKVYAYTFATPLADKNATSKGFKNIFNYINSTDPIPKLPLNHKRYGKTITLPEDKKGEMKKYFKMSTGYAYRDDFKLAKNGVGLIYGLPIDEGDTKKMFNCHTQTAYLSWLDAMYPNIGVSQMSGGASVFGGGENAAAGGR